MMPHRVALLLVMLIPALASANPPVASYIFPAGGQRGATVNVRVGGLFLHKQCGFEMLGTGITAPSRLTRTNTPWFEGPLLSIPESQRAEDYPKDMAGQLVIARDAPLGVRYWRLWTSQGATPAMKFVIGDLPEIIEDEIDGEPIPVKVTLPVTINGRIFPRENIDVWTFQAKQGQTIRCEVQAARLGSPLDARLEVRDPQGRKIAENDDYHGADPMIAFIASVAGEYQVHIRDTLAQGGPAYVYRLTLTSEPHIERVFPLGGRRGTTVDLDIAGQNVPHRMRAILPKQAGADYTHVFELGAKRTNPVPMQVDDLLEYLHAPDRQSVLVLPAILNGRIDKAGAIDEWRWQGRKGDVWEFQLRAAQLGSRLDGVVTIADSAGKTLAKAEANPLDPVLNFKVPADGVYAVRIQDRFRSRGGPDFAYRLRAVPPDPADFRLWLAADAVTLPRLGTTKLKITAERLGGFKEPIVLEVQGLPAGVSVVPAVLKTNQNTVDLLFKADAEAKIDVSHLTIVGKAKAGTQEIQRQAGMKSERGVPGLASVLLAVALPTPFVIKGEYVMGFAARGGIQKRTYKLERNGYDGSIEISLADRQARHLQGVSGPTILVPAGVSEFTYAAYLPPWMETSRTCRVCVMGVATIKEPDGTKHAVSFSSVHQNEQMVAVVGPGKLALETERTSYTAEPGKQFLINVRINRSQDIEGPVELELIQPAHLRGLSAIKTIIGSKQEKGQLMVRCADPLGGPFNMPVLVRATLLHNGDRVVAEMKIDVQP
jgi:hypothetical protein